MGKHTRTLRRSRHRAWHSEGPLRPIRGLCGDVALWIPQFYSFPGDREACVSGGAYKQRRGHRDPPLITPADGRCRPEIKTSYLFLRADNSVGGGVANAVEG